jgi:hypothetical protein
MSLKGAEAIELGCRGAFTRQYVYDGENLEAIVDRIGDRLHEVRLSSGRRIPAFEDKSSLPPFRSNHL